jgi:hypothetical protein
MGYDSGQAITNKFLRFDGAITDISGTVISAPNERGAQVWKAAQAITNKWLNPDGSIGELKGGGGSLAIPDDQSFPDNDTRDTFFTNNPDRLDPESPNYAPYCLVAGQLQMYIDGAWTDGTAAIKGDTGATGADGQNGADGANGADGFSPTVTVKTNTATTYILTVTYKDENGDTQTYDTPNLLGADVILKKLVDANNNTYELGNEADGGYMISNGSQYECGWCINGGNGAGTLDANGNPPTFPQVYMDTWSAAGTWNSTTQTWTHNGTKSRMLVQLFSDGLKQSTDGTNWTPIQGGGDDNAVIAVSTFLFNNPAYDPINHNYRVGDTFNVDGTRGYTVTTAFVSSGDVTNYMDNIQLEPTSFTIGDTCDRLTGYVLYGGFAWFPNVTTVLTQGMIDEMDELSQDANPHFVPDTTGFGWRVLANSIHSSTPGPERFIVSWTASDAMWASLADNQSVTYTTEEMTSEHPTWIKIVEFVTDPGTPPSAENPQGINWRPAGGSCFVSGLYRGFESGFESDDANTYLVAFGNTSQDKFGIRPLNPVSDSIDCWQYVNDTDEDVYINGYGKVGAGHTALFMGGIPYMVRTKINVLSGNPNNIWWNKAVAWGEEGDLNLEPTDYSTNNIWKTHTAPAGNNWSNVRVIYSPSSPVVYVSHQSGSTITTLHSVDLSTFRSEITGVNTVGDYAGQGILFFGTNNGLIQMQMQYSEALTLYEGSDGIGFTQLNRLDDTPNSSYYKFLAYGTYNSQLKTMAIGFGGKFGGIDVIQDGQYNSFCNNPNNQGVYYFIKNGALYQNNTNQAPQILHSTETYYDVFYHGGFYYVANSNGVYRTTDLTTAVETWTQVPSGLTDIDRHILSPNWPFIYWRSISEGWFYASGGNPMMEWIQLVDDDDDKVTGDYSFGLLNPDGDSFRFIGGDGVLRIDNNDYKATYTVTEMNLNNGFFDMLDNAKVYVAGNNGIYTAVNADIGPTSWGWIPEEITPLLPSEMRWQDKQTMQDFLDWLIPALEFKSDKDTFGPIMPSVGTGSSFDGLYMRLKDFQAWINPGGGAGVNTGTIITWYIEDGQGNNLGNYQMYTGNTTSANFYWTPQGGNTQQIIQNGVVQSEFADNIYPFPAGQIFASASNWNPTAPPPLFTDYDLTMVINNLLGVWENSNVAGATLIDKINTVNNTQTGIVIPVGGAVLNTAASWAPSGMTLSNVGSISGTSPTVYVYVRTA